MARGSEPESVIVEDATADCQGMRDLATTGGQKNAPTCRKRLEGLCSLP
jgi:hypothetical protein